jgi:hypothetical protein
VTVKKEAGNIRPNTTVMNALMHTGSSDMPISPHTIVPSALNGHKMHDVLAAFRDAAAEAQLAIRFVWTQYNLGPNLFYEDDEESDTACVLVMWGLPERPWRPLRSAKGLLGGMSYSLESKPATGFDDLEDIYDFRTV